MSMPLNVPTYPPDRYAPLADRLKLLLSTRSDVIFVQAEALLALEAAATSIARPAAKAINIVTSSYGLYFGSWLRRGGVSVQNVVAEPGQPISAQAVEVALAGCISVDIVATVHGEAANGALNPLPEIAALARSRDALLVVDAVASVGAHPLDVDALGIDIAVIGPGKALSGPTEVSAMSVSERAWAAIARAPDISPSNLSLAEIKAAWLDRGRGALPGTPPSFAFWALEAAIDRVETEGVDMLIARHQRAARASRLGLRALGVEPWIRPDAAASGLVTSAPVPAGVDGETLIGFAAGLGVTLGRGFGDIENKLVRLNHTGTKASFDTVLPSVIAYGAALGSVGHQVDVGAAADAVTASYAKHQS
jgi:aspartate aminotransferase-like enzyme